MTKPKPADFLEWIRSLPPDQLAIFTASFIGALGIYAAAIGDREFDKACMVFAKALHRKFPMTPEPPEVDDD